MTSQPSRALRGNTDVAKLAQAVAAIAVLSGCASLPENATRYPENTPAIELASTPFFPQERYQCGPAALTTVLANSGANVTLPAISQRVYLPERKGSLQLEMLAASRSANRIAYVIDPSLRAILAELDAGRPVVVLQNLGTGLLQRWHYAVVIGIDPGKERVVLRSGKTQRRLTDIDTFLRTWSRSDFWGFVVLRPGELPAVDNPLRFFESLAAMEQTGHSEHARPGWLAALERWPDHPVALFGLANTELASGNYVAAENLYRRLLEIDSRSLLGRNNLAYALAAQGKTRQAIKELNRALTLVGENESLRQQLEGSLSEIRRGI